MLLYLLLIRLLEISIFCFYKAKWFGLLSAEIGKNCFYRFLSNPSYNWRSLLLGIAKQFLRIVERRGGTCDDTPLFYIVDDTTLEKTGRSGCHTFPRIPLLFIKLFIFGVQSQIHPKRVFIGLLYLIGRKATSFVKSNGAVFFGCKCFNRKELTTS